MDEFEVITQLVRDYQDAENQLVGVFFFLSLYCHLLTWLKEKKGRLISGRNKLIVKCIQINGIIIG